ncbi:MAG: ABC transporter permease [Oscillospiraceae bacterium]|nr:ABC transporter permease [Oscillospiraceae bacterium]
MGKMPLNLFQLNLEKIPGFDAMTAEDFSGATNEEKASMIETRPSVSYWKDAARRFRANKVSMAALILFLLIFLFSYLGPLFIPYNYADQYRNSSKLGPREFSAKEQLLQKAEDISDLFFATSLMPGSLTSLSRSTTYYFKTQGVTYSFYVEKAIGDSVLLFNRDAENKLTLIKEKDLGKDALDNAKTVEYSTEAIDTKAPNVVELKMLKRICPHFFGTDSAGRDLMARTMYGGRVSIAIGIIAALIVLIIGSIYGSVSGLAGGTVDFVMMRLVDIIYSVPDVLIVLLLQVVLKNPLQSWLDASPSNFARLMSNLGVGIISIFITFACLYWVGMSRIVRGQVLQLKQQEFVTAANALGVPGRRIVKRHLLPNCVGQLVIATCLQIPSAIFLESFLSFLGLGVSIPMTSLGSLCSDALDTITLYPYRLLAPGLILTLLVLSLNLVGDGIRDALDPRLKK